MVLGVRQPPSLSPVGARFFPRVPLQSRTRGICAGRNFLDIIAREIHHLYNRTIFYTTIKKKVVVVVVARENKEKAFLDGHAG